MLSNLSSLNLAAVGLYLFVTVLALGAASGGIRYRQQGWHLRVWGLVVMLFLALAVLRGMGVEELWRDQLRAMFRADDVYDRRRDIQRPLAATVIALVGAGMFLWAYRGFRQVRGRRNVAVMVAGACAFVMMALVALRLISLHSVDMLLYGPLKINWIIDIGASLVVAGAAGYYFQLVRRRP